jgi:hypothetical protein
MEVSDVLHTPAALPSREVAPDTHLIGGWVGPSVGLHDVDKSLALLGIEPRPSSQ